MKALILCPRIPFPPADGGSIAMVQLQKGLHEAGVQTDVLAFNTTKHHIDPSSFDPGYCSETRLETVDLDNRVKPIPALIQLLKGESYHISRFDSSGFHQVLQQKLKQDPVDFVLLESLSMAPYLPDIRAHSTSLVILRAHNVEHVIWQKLARKSGNPARRAYLNILSRQLKDFECRILNAVDGIAAIAETDANVFRGLAPKTPICVIPTSLDVPSSPAETRSSLSPVVAHLGAMDWMPNREGIEWFLREVWPRVQAKNQSLTLRIAGKHMPEKLRALNKPGLEVSGYIEDAKAFLGQADMLFVPLLSGSGMRVKLAEGMSLGKAIVTTSQGCEGIDAEHGQELLVADSPDDFASCILQLAADKALRQKIGSGAHQFATARFSSQKITQDFIRFLNTLELKKSNRTVNSLN
ncbi:MAG: glycosyltransferase [Bacteroidota bacterium]